MFDWLKLGLLVANSAFWVAVAGVMTALVAVH